MSNLELDPLSGIEIPPHPVPTPISILNSNLSSVLDDVEQYLAFKDKAMRVLTSYTPANSNDDTAPVLRIFLDKLPKDGQMVLSIEIEALGSSPKLQQLRDFLVDTILKPFKFAKPSEITQSTFEGAETEISDNMGMIEASTRDVREQLKLQCLRRDGYRCVHCHGYIKVQQQLKYRAHVPQGARRIESNCCHIFPLALSKFNENNAREVRTKTTIWWSIHRYFPRLPGKLDASSLNQPANAMTLCVLVHSDFNSHDLAFAPIRDKPNTYHLHTFKSQTLVSVDSMGPNKVITLRSFDESVPLPDPDFLDARFRIAQILDVSGIGVKIDYYLYQATEEDPTIINPDGSTDLGNIIRHQLLIFD